AHSPALAVTAQRPKGWVPEKPRQLQQTTAPDLPHVVALKRLRSSRRHAGVSAVSALRMRWAQPRNPLRVAVGPQSHCASIWARTAATNPLGQASRPMTTDRWPIGGPGTDMPEAANPVVAEISSSTAINQVTRMTVPLN